MTALIPGRRFRLRTFLTVLSNSFEALLSDITITPTIICSAVLGIKSFFVCASSEFLKDYFFVMSLCVMFTQEWSTLSILPSSSATATERCWPPVQPKAMVTNVLAAFLYFDAK